MTYIQPTLLYRSLFVLLIRNSFVPFRLPNADNKVRHYAPVISAVPVRRARRCPDSVAGLDPSGLSAFVTNPPTAGKNSDHLPTDVSMPVRTGAWCEGDVCYGRVLIAMGHFEIDLASEGAGRLGDFRSRRWDDL